MAAKVKTTSKKSAKAKTATKKSPAKSPAAATTRRQATPAAGGDKQSDKPLCGAQRSNQPPGTLCTRPAGWGTNHVGIGRCKRHGGATTNHEKAAEKVIALRACDNLGVKVETTPLDALWGELYECAGNVEFYRQRVQELPNEPAPDVYEVEDGERELKYTGAAGKYGRTYHHSGLPTGEAKPHVWVSLYNEERNRLRQVCAEMLKAGVEQRRLELAEADAQRIFGAVAAAFAAIDLTPRLDEFRTAFATALRDAIQQSAAGGIAGRGGARQLAA